LFSTTLSRCNCTRRCGRSLRVREHLRSQIEGAEREAELTPNEVDLVRFAADRSDQLKELADRPSDK
jgi:hypothetical protein